jgi:glycosyltransferase involved in cell wall biosynthesis
MAMEIPVISTRVSGIPELIDDGKSGILVEQKDTAALSEAIRRLVCDPGLREQFAVQGRKKIIEEFNQHQNSVEIGELFQHYLGSHREQ